MDDPNAPLRLRWSAERIAARVTALGVEIAQAHAGRDLLLVAVLKGGAVFLADLVRSLPGLATVDFLAVRALDPRRGAEAQPVALLKDLDTDIAGRDVVLVEDIVDSGVTLAYLLRALWARQPASLATCVLVDRPERRIAHLALDYVGFTAGSGLLVGYGIDLDGWFRNCPDLWEVLDEGAVRADPQAALRYTRAPAVGGPGSVGPD